MANIPVRDFSLKLSFAPDNGGVAGTAGQWQENFGVEKEHVMAAIHSWAKSD
jgi:hypothetical protein